MIGRIVFAIVVIGVGLSWFGCARAAEIDAARPWLLWSVEPGERALPRLRGTYTVRTACELDLASLANVLPRASRLSCERMKDGGKR